MCLTTALFQQLPGLKLGNSYNKRRLYPGHHTKNRSYRELKPGLHFALQFTVCSLLNLYT